MTHSNTLMAALALIAAAATPALAQMAEIDLDGDGMYSLTEVQAVLPEMTEDDFMLLDASGDGLLDAEEIATGTEAGILPG